MLTIELTSKASEDDKFVGYTKQIIAALKTKAAEHNSNSTSIVKIQQLIDVFAAGEQNCTDKSKLHECCWARVNMFLGLMNGVTSFAELSKAKKLALVNRQWIDMSSAWEPNATNYTQAQADIARFNLKFDFDNVNQLYFYKREKSLIEHYL